MFAAWLQPQTSPLGFFFPSPSFAAAGELTTFDLAAADRVMARPLCIRNEVSGSVSNLAVAVLASLAETEQGFVHLTAAIAIPSCFPSSCPAQVPPRSSIPPTNPLRWVSGSCLVQVRCPLGDVAPSRNSSLVQAGVPRS